MARLLAFVLVLLSNLPHRAEARWERIHDFGGAMSLVYFVTPNDGFAGTGWVSNPQPVAIFKTSDGGSTWKRCPSPRIDEGVVASISIKGSVGYAAIKLLPTSDERASIWKTTDGGESWFDASPTGVEQAVQVLDVGKSIVVSTWDGGAWVNLPPSLVWNLELEVPGNQYRRTNGMATNGTDVVVTDFRSGEFFSTDGGESWDRANDIPESWSVYNLEGTRNFYAASEGVQDDLDPDRNIYRSTNGGASWQVLYHFTDTRIRFTGHIDGKGTRIYFQSAISANLGMYRSDDLGLSWKAVGGPSGNRDTRFSVQGCGEIVYALNTQGQLFKTTDGGDSTFIADGFYLGQPAGGYVGDTIDIPLYVRNVSAATTINGTRLKLNVDRDLLDNWSTKSGTITPNGDELDLDLTFTPPLTSFYDKTIPVAVLRAKNYLTTTTTLPLELTTIEIQATKETAPCGVSQVTYMQLPSCGDATMRAVMLKEAEGIVRITPSPVVSTATIELRNAQNATLTVYDMLGREMTGCVRGDQLNAQQLPAGSYVLVLLQAGRVLDRKSFVVAH
jgi:photosystem II stability/assembly factor-like uncharacterized protein